MADTQEKKVVLVTGASAGFGREIAVLLARSGYTVYGTSRSPKPNPDFPMVALDVRDDASVRSCVDHILLAHDRIDVLVNNAGYLLSGLVEEVSLEEAHAQFETNFFGVHRMTRAVLPVMRKQGGGRIVTIGSLGGLVAAPGHGFYYASKFAIEGYSESLAHEVRNFNVRVTIVEPGYFRTNLHAAMVRVAEPIPDYDVIRKPLFEALEQGVGHGGDPKDVARLVKKIIEDPLPKLRYQIGPGAHWIPFARFVLPQRLFAWLVRKWFRLEK